MAPELRGWRNYKAGEAPSGGGGGGKECEARHERSNDWPQGARSAPLTRIMPMAQKMRGRARGGVGAIQTDGEAAHLVEAQAHRNGQAEEVFVLISFEGPDRYAQAGG